MQPLFEHNRDKQSTTISIERTPSNRPQSLICSNKKKPEKRLLGVIPITAHTISPVPAVKVSLNPNQASAVTLKLSHRLGWYQSTF